MTTKSDLRFLEDRWDDEAAAKLDAPELLRYRSNLLGSDLRITNFGGAIRARSWSRWIRWMGRRRRFCG